MIGERDVDGTQGDLRAGSRGGPDLVKGLALMVVALGSSLSVAAVTTETHGSLAQNGNVPGWLEILSGLVALMAALVLLLRLAQRQTEIRVPISSGMAVPLLAGALGAVPFVLVQTDGEIFTIVLVLVIGTLAGFAGRMLYLDVVASLILGTLAVIFSPNGFWITFVLLPLVLVVALATASRRWWVAPGLVLLLALAGLGESRVLPAKEQPEPLLTMRLIADGPGLQYLRRSCEAIPSASCALVPSTRGGSNWSGFEPLPTASVLLTGFLALSPETRAAVLDEQPGFARRVFLGAPVETLSSLIAAALDQANRYDVRDLPSMAGVSHSGWLAALAGFHTLVYAISALLIVVLIVLPQNAPPLRMRAVLAVILSGIMVNAFVGGLQGSASGAATGASMLPMGLALLLMFYAPARAARESDFPHTARATGP